LTSHASERHDESEHASHGMLDSLRFGKVAVDQLEWREGDTLAWHGRAQYGGDLNRLVLKSEGERSGGGTHEAEAQLLYSRAIAPFWDLQLGWRHDFQPRPQRGWAALGIRGLAPYLFETEATLFIGESGRTALRLAAEYELLLTQRLILTPQLEANFHGEEDRDTATGSGLSDLEFGLRLRYEIRREFAPYLGVTWQRRYGDSAGFSTADGSEREETRVVAGLRFWF
jgi:copper resistance protein B